MTSRRPRPPSDGGGRFIDGELLLCLAVLGSVVVAATFWLAGGLASVVSGHHWPALAGRDLLTLLPGVLRHPGDPGRAWPAVDGPARPSAAWWYASWFGVISLPVGLALLFRLGGRRSKAARRSVRAPGASWAGRRELEVLRVRRPTTGRLVVGTSGRRLVAVERGQSVLVVGPTQSGKTSGLAIPALLEWQGPAVATSVKTDLIRDTHVARRELGTVEAFDPAAVTNLSSSTWSPLSDAASWSGARRVASAFCGVARGGGSGLDEAAFWYATAEKLLAPLFFAAAASGRTIADVVRWVDTGEVDEVLDALDRTGVAEAVRSAEASFSREERQRSSVYTTAETVLAAFADPLVLAACVEPGFDPHALLAGGSDTIYLVAPAHEQERLQSVFVALLRSIVDEAVTVSSRRGAPLDPPLLIVLDEAANVAPLASLDTLASTAASHGIQLVTVWQDLAQIEARYGGRAATVVNNHRAKVFCSGITDGSTLEQASRLIGDEDRIVDSTTTDGRGGWSRTRTTAPRRLAPAELLRAVEPGRAVLVYGHLPPIALRLRPFYRSRQRGAPNQALYPATITRGRPPARATPPRRRHPRWRRARPSG